MIYGYRDITDVVFKDLSTGNPAIFLDYLQTASQTYGNEIVYQMGARGAPKLVGFQAKNGLKLDITSALISPELLALMFGTDVVLGTQYVPVTQKFTVTTNSITLPATPYVTDLVNYPVTCAYSTDGSAPKVQLTKTVSATPATAEFYLSNNIITVNSITYASGGTFIVTYYKQSTASNKRVRFQTDKFTKSYKVEGYTLWKNTSDDKLYPCRVTIPKLQIEINGAQLNSAMDGNPTSFKFSGEALKTNTATDLILYDVDEGEIIT